MCARPGSRATAHRGHELRNALCALLLERGADVHARDDQQLNALFFALMAGNFELIVWLMKRGAMSLSSQIPCPCASHAFPPQLQSETQLLHDDDAVAERIEHCAQRCHRPMRSARRSMRGSPNLSRAAGHSRSRAPWPTAPTPTRRAAAAGCCPSVCGGEGRHHEHQEAHRRRARIDARDAAGRTALAIAVVQAALSALRALLAYGADPNVADKDGRTPLWRAAGEQQRRTTHGGFSDPYAQIKAGLRGRRHRGCRRHRESAARRGRGAMINATDARDGITLHAPRSGQRAVARVLSRLVPTSAPTLVPMVHAGVTCATSGVSPLPRAASPAARRRQRVPRVHFRERADERR